MGLSKKDISRRKATLKAHIEELEVMAKSDPLKRNVRLHEELNDCKKKLAELAD